jgi:hypothetical protein
LARDLKISVQNAKKSLFSILGRTAPHDGAFFENHRIVAVSANANVRVLPFSGAVYHTTHNGHSYVFRHCLKPWLPPLQKSVNIEALATATGARNYFHTFLSQSAYSQNFLSGNNFVKATVGEADPQSVSDALFQ